jgi:hypothetical protein
MQKHQTVLSLFISLLQIINNATNASTEVLYGLQHLSDSCKSGENIFQDIKICYSSTVWKVGNMYQIWYNFRIIWPPYDVPSQQSSIINVSNT